jgi:hypothetical protein
VTRQLGAAIVGATIAIGPAVTPASAQTAGRRYALLIGVNAALQSGVRKLNFVDNDVIELKRLMERQGYEVRTIQNERGDRAGIVYRHALALNERDTFVLYFAGHGVRNVEMNQKTYWLTDNADLRILDVHGIRLDHLLSYVDDIRAERKLILLDHCFSGDVVGLNTMPTVVAPPPPAPTPAAAPDASESAVASRKASVVIAKEVNTPRREGTTVIAAARNEAFELKGHGVFTQALLDACNSVQNDDRNYKRSIRELVLFLQPHVNKLLDDAKAPMQTLLDIPPPGGTALLEWPFCTLPVSPAEVAPQVAELQTNIQTWETKGLLSPLLRIACTAILDKWRNAAGDAALLTEREQRVLVAMRLFADANDLTPEQARVLSLIDVLRREGY